MLPDEPDETDTARDGLLSYSGEWHASTIGLYHGLTTLHPWRDDYAERARRYDDVAREPWYYHAGFVAGTVLQVLVILVLAWVVM